MNRILLGLLFVSAFGGCSPSQPAAPAEDAARDSSTPATNSAGNGDTKDSPPVSTPAEDLTPAQDTPLGQIVDIKVATGEKMVGSWEEKPKAGRAFVLVEIHAKRAYPSADITTWAAVDSDGKRHGIVAVMTDFGTLTGVGSMAAPGGTPDKPQKNTFVFETPESAASRLDLFVGDERLGVLTK